MTEWTIGTRVVVAGRHERPMVTTVSAISPTGTVITTADGRKWKNNGELRGSGDSWFPTRIRSATPEDERDVERRRLVERLSRVKWGALPIDDLREISTKLDGRSGNHDRDDADRSAWDKPSLSNRRASR